MMMINNDIKNNEVKAKTERIRRSKEQIEVELRGEVWTPVVKEKAKKGSVRPEIIDLPAEYRTWGGKTNTGATIVLKLNEIRKPEIVISDKGIDNDRVIDFSGFYLLIDAYKKYIGFNIEENIKKCVTTENKIAVVKTEHTLRLYFPVQMLKDLDIIVRHRIPGTMNRKNIDLTKSAEKVEVAEIIIEEKQSTRRKISDEEKAFMEQLVADGISKSKARNMAKEKFAIAEATEEAIEVENEEKPKKQRTPEYIAYKENLINKGKSEYEARVLANLKFGKIREIKEA